MNEGEELSDTMAAEFEEDLAKMREIEGEAKSADYLECTWWKKCYVCKQSNGRWRIIRCYA